MQGMETVMYMELPYFLTILDWAVQGKTILSSSLPFYFIMEVLSLYWLLFIVHNLHLYNLTHREPELVRKIGVATALEVRGTGMHHVLAPCIAVWLKSFKSKPF